MASRRFTSQFSFSFQKQAVRLMAKAVAGSQSGAGVFTITQGLGQAVTIARTGTGLYTINAGNTYKGLIGFNVQIGRSSGASGLRFEVVSDAAISTTGAITTRVISGTTPTDLTAADVLYITLELSNS